MPACRAVASYGHVKRRVAEILDIPSAPDDAVGRWFDRFIVTLIAVNVVVVVLESMDGYLDRYGAAFRAFEVFSLVVFSVEYALRVWSITAKPEYADPVRGRLRFVVTPFALIDLLAIVPGFFPAQFLGADLRLLRVLRMLRLLKLTKYSDSFRILTTVLRRSREELLTAFSLVMVALLLVSTFMYYAEREAQPEKFASIPAAMYWGVISLTTTGYGDVVPMTTAGKLLASATAILGVAVIALPVGILASGFVEELNRRRRQEACPHCGKVLGR